MYIACVTLRLFSTLSRRAGALQIPIITVWTLEKLRQQHRLSGMKRATSDVVIGGNCSDPVSFRRKDSLPDTAIRGCRQDGLEGVHVLQGHNLGQVGPPANHLLQSILQQTKKSCCCCCCCSARQLNAQGGSGRWGQPGIRYCTLLHY